MVVSGRLEHADYKSQPLHDFLDLLCPDLRRVPSAVHGLLEQACKICRTVLGILAGKLDVDTAVPLGCMYDGHLRRHQRRCGGEEFVDPLTLSPGRPTGT